MQLQVIGLTWQGFESSYSYSVPERIQTDAEVRRFAGDFSSITDWQLIQTTRHDRQGKNWREARIRTTVLRPWQKKMSASKFLLGEGQ